MKFILKPFKIKELVSLINSVEDMPDTSRLESKKFKILRTRMRIEEIARNALEELSRLAGLKVHNTIPQCKSYIIT